MIMGRMVAGFGRRVTAVLLLLGLMAATAVLVDADRPADAQGGALCAGLPVTVYLVLGQLPTDFADVILGTDGDDQIAAGAGDDVICGEGGNDRIFGQAGQDYILGGFGDDFIRGGDGNDVVYAGPGDDNVTGGRDHDLLHGEAGADTIRGGTGTDSIYGGDGDDPQLAGNGGEDLVVGGAGNDPLITGGPRPDQLWGGPGNDSLKGHKGADMMYGESGLDILAGGPQADQLNGGGDADECFGGEGADSALACEFVSGIDPVPSVDPTPAPTVTPVATPVGTVAPGPIVVPTGAIPPLIVGQGDSRTSNDSYASRVAANVIGSEYIDLGKPGAATAAMLGDTNYICAEIESGQQGIVLLAAGYNDVNGRTDAASDIYHRLSVMISDYRSCGYFVIVSTQLGAAPTNSFGLFEADQQAVLNELNIRIRENNAGADAVADPVAALGSPTNTAYFSVDGVHLNEDGRQLWANLILPLLPAL